MATKTFEERIAHANSSQNKEVEYYKRWFKANENKLKTNGGISFTRTQGHEDYLERNKALRAAGFNVTTTSPEYDGMVRHYIELTKDVEL
jgi:hypothetical protein